MKYRAALFSSAFCLVFVSVFFVGRFVWADQYGLEATASAADLVKETSVPTIIGNVIGAGLSLVTVLFFILMIYAGIKWMLARGDEGKAKEALDTIVAAIIGIVVVLAAYAITNFVFKSVGEQGSSGGGSNTSDSGDGGDATAGTCSPKAFWAESSICNNFLQKLKNGTATGQPEGDKVVDEDATCNNMGGIAYAPADVKAAQCVWSSGNCITQKAVDAKDFCGTVTDGPTCTENTDCVWN